MKPRTPPGQRAQFQKRRSRSLRDLLTGEDAINFLEKRQEGENFLET
jgi:hypothetical protein